MKSLLAFGQRVGYLRFDVGAAVKLPPVKDALAERILDREAVLRLIDREPDARNRALLRLLYAGGLRVSEACALRWRDLRPRDDAGQVTVYGKGGQDARGAPVPGDLAGAHDPPGRRGGRGWRGPGRQRRAGRRRR